MNRLIITKRLPPTNTRGTRIKATWVSDAGATTPRSVTLPWEYAFDGEANRVLAAYRLAETRFGPQPNVEHVEGDYCMVRL